MDPCLKKTIVAGCLGAFALETIMAVPHWVGVGHGLPSALQIGTGLSTSSIAVTTVVHFGNAITEAVYLNLPDSAVLPHNGEVQLPLPPKPGSEA